MVKALCRSNWDVKRCPCCGGDAIQLIRSEDAPEAWVECRECGTETEMFSFDENAVQAWNEGRVTRKVEKQVDKISDYFRQGKRIKAYIVGDVSGFKESVTGQGEKVKELQVQVVTTDFQEYSYLGVFPRSKKVLGYQSIEVPITEIERLKVEE